MARDMEGMEGMDGIRMIAMYDGTSTAFSMSHGLPRLIPWVFHDIRLVYGVGRATIDKPSAKLGKSWRSGFSTSL